jgi:hypothetical protein
MERRIKLLAVIIGVLTLLFLPAFNGFCVDPSPQTHIYFTEYKKPVSGNVSTINAVFFNRVDSNQVERFLRLELERVIKLFSPQTDLLATAWLGGPTEKMVKLPDGSNHLIYVFSKKKIYTWKEYEKFEGLLPPTKK